ncbi:hypothetical protein BASA81_004869 [Batrachochytrium salamandrivorans]|nr:hypothetical protein BASA81_004869 [Batrachochytrium salamandrivorans]
MDREGKLQRVKDEILSTERSYVEDLSMCVEVFMKPLLASRPDPVLTRDQIHIIFNNLEVIIALNTQLLQALQDSTLPDSPTTIGQIFLDLSPYLKMYTVFVKHYAEASAMHQRLMGESSRYAQFIEYECFAPNQDRLRNRALGDFLIMPVQRVPRYKLLLQELVNLTVGPEHSILQSALDQVTAVAKMVNESIQEHLDRMKVLNVQKRFGDQVHLVEPQRKYVLEGQLVKHCRRGPKRYSFFLFTDVLIYATAEEQGLVYKRTLPLNTMSLQLVDQPHEFAFQLSSPQKSFILSAKNDEERHEWAGAISTCIQRWLVMEQEELQRTQETVVSSVSSTPQKKRTQNIIAAPLWVPDREAPSCQTCENKFTFFNRKHHCRHCGHVVCADCSAYRFVLPNLGNSTKPQRVCQECYVEIRDQVIINNTVSSDLQQGNRPAPPSMVSSTSVNIRRSIKQPTSPTSEVLVASSTVTVAEEEYDFDLASHWRVLLDDLGKKYYWSTSTDVITYTRPLRAVEEEAAALHGARRTHMSHRFTFRKRTSNVDGEPDPVALLQQQLLLQSEYSSNNPLLAHHYQLSETHEEALKEEPSSLPQPPPPPLPQSRSNHSPSLADTLAQLADTGTFGEDASKSRFSSRRINALASLASSRNSKAKRSPSSSGGKYGSLVYRSPRAQSTSQPVAEEEDVTAGTIIC